MTPLPSRRAALAAFVAAAALGAPDPLMAQATWKPGSPVKLVVPYPPGGTADLAARLLQAGLSERLGQPVVVENRPGATGSLGGEYVHGSPPDATVLLVGTSDGLSIYPHLYKGRADLTRLTPVAGLTSTALVLVGRSDLPASNLQELQALMKQQSLSYATAGTGSSPHMLAVAFAQALKVENLLHVPYPGNAQAIQAVAGRQVDMLFVPVATASPLKSRLKFFAVTSKERVPTLPEVPTLSEIGVPVVGTSWIGVFAPPNTPDVAIATLAKAIGEVTADAPFQHRTAELGIQTLSGTSAQFGRYHAEDRRFWGEVVRKADIKLD